MLVTSAGHHGFSLSLSRALSLLGMGDGQVPRASNPPVLSSFSLSLVKHSLLLDRSPPFISAKESLLSLFLRKGESQEVSEEYTGLSRHCHRIPSRQPNTTGLAHGSSACPSGTQPGTASLECLTWKRQQEAASGKLGR